LAPLPILKPTRTPANHGTNSYPVYEPFGIPAGPLLNGRYVSAALAKGFDIVTYKT
jgi:hypothetical protein